MKHSNSGNSNPTTFGPFAPPPAYTPDPHEIGGIGGQANRDGGHCSGANCPAGQGGCAGCNQPR